MKAQKPWLKELNLRIGWPLVVALLWSFLVVLGCVLAMFLITFDDNAKAVVVLVRNISVVGAAAIALPLSIYVFWMRERSFQIDLDKAVREEVQRQKEAQDQERDQELERAKEQGREEAREEFRREQGSIASDDGGVE